MFSQYYLKCNSKIPWISLVILWLRTHLLVQGTRGRSLVLEDATCHLAAKLCSTATESLRPWSPCSTTREAPTGGSPCTATGE